MKRILSFLLCVVFLHSQAFAMSGGPTFGGSGTLGSVIGTYSGVMIPTVEVGLNVAADTTGEGFNSIGIFSVGVPQAGIATGTFGFFGNGQVYNGVMTGVADPDKGTLDCILDAPTTLLSPTGEPYIGQALGSLRAKIKSAPLGTVGGSLGRLDGTAHIDVFEGDFNEDLSVAVASSFDFIVDGFKQSDQVTASDVVLGGGAVSQ
jgi:hypothetical protein